MSHTLTITTDEYGEVTLNHNSDWSGLVEITWIDEENEQQRVWLPGALLISLGYEAAADKIREAITLVLDET